MTTNGSNPLGQLAYGGYFDSAPTSSLSPGQVRTRDQRRIEEEFEKQVLVQRAIAAKGVVAATQIGLVHDHVNREFDNTVGAIIARKAETRTPEHQVYYSAFTEQQIPMLARHLIGVVEVTATRIGEEVHRSVYPAPLPWWRQIVG